jgi:hypothetical protein
MQWLDTPGMPWSGRHARVTFVLLALSASGLARAQEQGPSAAAEETASATGEAGKSSPHAEQERRRYLWNTFGPPGLLDDGLTAVFHQWRDEPRAWGRGNRALARRFVSEYAESAVADTTRYLFARALDEDPSFQPCGCRGLLPRLRYATLAPFRARKRDGRIVFSAARLAGVTAGKVISTSVWYPSPRGPGAVAQHVAVDLAGKIGWDLLREFVIHRRRER